VAIFTEMFQASLAVALAISAGWTAGHYSAKLC